MTNYQVLKLNADYSPMEVISWQDAVGLWWAKKVEIVTEYEDFNLKAVSFTMKCPAVVRLLEYVGYRRRVKYSRVNIYNRDNYTCQYCGKQPGTPNLNLDHVVPREKGGKTTWENIVTSCIPCNTLKANKSLQESGMTLRTVPSRPTDAYKFTFAMPKTPDAWRDFLYWEQELENDNEG